MPINAHVPQLVGGQGAVHPDDGIVMGNKAGPSAGACVNTSS